MCLVAGEGLWCHFGFIFVCLPSLCLLGGGVGVVRSCVRDPIRCLTVAAWCSLF